MKIKDANELEKKHKKNIALVLTKYLAFFFLGGCLFLLAIFIYYTCEGILRKAFPFLLRDLLS